VMDQPTVCALDRLNFMRTCVSRLPSREPTDPMCLRHFVVHSVIFYKASGILRK
jgi:hypothetical protein